MPRPLLELAEAHEIRAIARRALSALYRPSRLRDVETADLGIDEEEADRRERLRYRGILEALRFCAYAAALRQDPSLLDVIDDAIRAKRDLHFRAPQDDEALGEALAALLSAGAPVDADVERLAKDLDPTVRAGVAAGLGLRVALVNDLLTDHDPRVHAQAKASLEPLMGPWWRGRFREDPLMGRTPEDAARLRPLLEHIDTMLDRPSDERRERTEELLDRLDQLPAAMAVELLSNLLSAKDPDLQIPASVARLAAREGGIEALIRLVRLRGGSIAGHPEDAAVGITRLPRERREEVLGALLSFAVSAPDAERLDEEGAPALAAGLAAVAWPEDGALGPYLDALLGLPPPEEYGPLDQVAVHLGLLFERPGMDLAQVLPRILDARLAGYPGSWALIREGIERRLERLPVDARRGAVEQALARERTRAAMLGATVLTSLQGAALEPASIEHTVAEDELSLRALPGLRVELRRGGFALKEAWHTLRTIDDLYGGLAPTSPPDDTLDAFGDPEALAREREDRRRRAGGLLGPEALRGPVTEEEWRAYRRALSSFPEDHALRPWYALTALPPGDWLKEDLRELDRAMARLRGGDEALWCPIALSLAAKPDPDLLPLFDELAARIPAERARLRELRRDTLHRLGGPPGYR